MSNKQATLATYNDQTVTVLRRDPACRNGHFMLDLTLIQTPGGARVWVPTAEVR